MQAILTFIKGFFNYVFHPHVRKEVNLELQGETPDYFKMEGFSEETDGEDLQSFTSYLLHGEGDPKGYAKDLFLQLIQQTVVQIRYQDFQVIVEDMKILDEMVDIYVEAIERMQELSDTTSLLDFTIIMNLDLKEEIKKMLEQTAVQREGHEGHES